ncbi:MAG: hypothetical protein C0613_10585 [Desulfobulbaceae bacterium]|nr:MAG: hypothetical protein C0613_10585 [Desulfobulbaceae bacterium]
MKDIVDTQLIDQQGIGFITQCFSKIGCVVNEHLRETGIDAVLEIRDSSYRSSGAFVALQLKSGESFFKNETDEYYNLYIDHGHIDYWLRSLIPVIFIIYSPNLNEAFWVKIEKSTISQKQKTYKISIPKNNKLTTTTKKEIYSVVFGKLYDSDDSFQEVEEGLISIVSIQNPVIINGMELFLNGLIENCTQLYFHTDICNELSDIKAYRLGEKGYAFPKMNFFDKYFKHINYHNLLIDDFSFEARFMQETNMLPQFIKPLSLNGLRFINFLISRNYTIRDRILVSMLGSHFDAFTMN